MLKLRIHKTKCVKTPSYAHVGDAGIDLYSAEQDYILKTGERKAFATGIKMEIPGGYVGLVWDKSGIALKNGIKTMAGVIDATYRGEIIVVLINLGAKEYKIKKNTKIAQMLIQKVERVKIELVDSLENTERGANGFGSTGI